MSYAPKLNEEMEELGPNPREFRLTADGSVYETKMGKLSKNTVRVHDKTVIRLVRRMVVLSREQRRAKTEGDHVHPASDGANRDAPAAAVGSGNEGAASGVADGDDSDRAGAAKEPSSADAEDRVR